MFRGRTDYRGKRWYQSPDLFNEARRRANRSWFPIYFMEGQDRHTLVRDIVAQVDRISKALEPMAQDGAPDGEPDPEANPPAVEGDGGEVVERRDLDADSD